MCSRHAICLWPIIITILCWNYLGFLASKSFKSWDSTASSRRPTFFKSLAGLFSPFLLLGCLHIETTFHKTLSPTKGARVLLQISFPGPNHALADTWSSHKGQWKIAACHVTLAREHKLIQEPIKYKIQVVGGTTKCKQAPKDWKSTLYS